MSLKIAATGYVDAQGGSVASANAIMLRGLLERGFEVHFFSKSSFVDPRSCVEGLPNFHFHETTNTGPDQLRRRLSRFPLLRQTAIFYDSATYEKLLIKRIGEAHKQENFALCLWLGTYATKRIPNLPMVSFAQGPPGTDARSLIERQDEIASLAGARTARKWATLARLRLSKRGLPKFAASDHIIVGSQQSIRTLADRYHIAPRQMSALPYPIDLQDFRLPDSSARRKQDLAPENSRDVLRVLWLGRVVPRKRLDVFLDGAALAIQRGLPIELTLVGQMALIPQYQQLIERFPFPDRLKWHQHLPRVEVPALLWQHDVLSQPSDEENFGSSVAEAQACGLPAIVGHTNGNADYLCPRSIHLADDSKETYADALETLYKRKLDGQWGEASVSRQTAEANFTPDAVVQKLVGVLTSLK